MVEEVDLDDKLEYKATNEVVDDVKKVAMEGVDKEKHLQQIIMVETVGLVEEEHLLIHHLEEVVLLVKVLMEVMLVQLEGVPQEVVLIQQV